MRYDQNRSEATRRHIIETAAKRFREEGIAGLGVAAVMASAGLTHGGFYSHFASKEDLVKLAVAHSFEKRRSAILETVRRGGGLSDIVRSYLSARHRDNPGHGCVVTTLGAELVRHGDDTRATLADGIDAHLSSLSTLWPDLPLKQQRSKAIVLYGMLIGILQLARATTDAASSDEILTVGLDAALAFGGDSPSS